MISYRWIKPKKRKRTKPPKLTQVQKAKRVLDNLKRKQQNIRQEFGKFYDTSALLEGLENSIKKQEDLIIELIKGGQHE